MFPKDPLVKGYYPIHNFSAEKPETDKQDAATMGLLMDHEGNRFTDQMIVAIDTSRLNDTNNTVEKVLASVRNTLENAEKRRLAPKG